MIANILKIKFFYLFLLNNYSDSEIRTEEKFILLRIHQVLRAIAMIPVIDKSRDQICQTDVIPTHFFKFRFNRNHRNTCTQIIFGIMAIATGGCFFSKQSQQINSSKKYGTFYLRRQLMASYKPSIPCQTPTRETPIVLGRQSLRLPLVSMATWSRLPLGWRLELVPIPSCMYLKIFKRTNFPTLNLYIILQLFLFV